MGRNQDGLARFERSDNGKWQEAQRVLRGQHISSIIFEKTTGTLFAGAFFGSCTLAPMAARPGSGATTASPTTTSIVSPSNVVNGKVRVYAGTNRRTCLS